MRSKSFLSLVCLFACGACQAPAQADRTYTVAVTFLPEKLDPRRNQINVYHYMILQLYEPLLRMDAGKTCSAFLDITRTQSLSRNFDNYRLCLRDDARFTDGSPVQVGDLATSLQATHAVQELLPRLDALKVAGDCVEVQLGKRDPQYLDKLTTAASTVLKRGTEGERLPTGLGPYVIDSWKEDHVHMTFRGTKPHVDFPAIDFVKVCDLDEAIGKGLMDLNLMYWEPRRHAALAHWPKLHHAMMRSYAMIASIPDPELRKQFVACFNRQRYLDDAMSLDLVASRGFLPPKSLGSDVDFDQVQAGLATGECRFEGPKPTITYVNQIYPDSEALQKFFRDEAVHLPLNVVVQDRSRADLIRMFTARETMLFAIGIDSVNSQAAELGESSVFFEVFVRDDRYIPEPLDGVATAVHAALDTSDRLRKAGHYKDAHLGLLQSAYVIPLGQLPPTLFYPTAIKQVEFADSVIGYPRIDWVVARKRWWQ